MQADTIYKKKTVYIYKYIHRFQVKIAQKKKKKTESEYRSSSLVPCRPTPPQLRIPQRAPFQPQELSWTQTRESTSSAQTKTKAKHGHHKSKGDKIKNKCHHAGYTQECPKVIHQKFHI